MLKYGAAVIEIELREKPDIPWVRWWKRAEFPHPLITIDYGPDDQVIGVSAVGSKRGQLLRLYAQALGEGLTPEQFIEQFIREL